MEAHLVSHPAPEVLRALVAGQLDGAAADAAFAHLESCTACREAAAVLSGDSFLNRLRAARPSKSTMAEARGAGDTQGSKAEAPTQTFVPPPVLPELRDHPQYEVLRQLGHGGMGVVYLARNKLMDRPEVLKVVGKHLLGSPAAAERFQREIRSAARLSHPNIVAAHAAFEAGDILVFAMEFIDGETLEETVERRGQLPVVNACYYAQQAAQGLQHACDRGMVHRDIKPQNLILAREGKKHTVKILDFGLAKATREGGQGDHGLTGTGAILGTPDYIAPEQTLDAAAADIRADIYSLGCTLYFLLSGTPPFQGASLLDILQAHQSKEATPLDRVRADVPAELTAVVAKMMAKDPARRYQKPAEVVQALAPFVQSGLKPPRTPPTPPQGAAKGAPVLPVTIVERGNTFAEPSRPSRKRSLVLGLSAAALLGTLVLAGLVGLWAAGVFRSKTADGILVVEVNESNPDVYVDGDRMTVTWGDGGKKAEIRVKPGTHRVQVKKDGFTAFGEEVELREGQQRVLTARLVSQAPAIGKAGDTPSSSAAPEPSGQSAAPIPKSGAAALFVKGSVWRDKGRDLEIKVTGRDGDRFEAEMFQFRRHQRYIEGTVANGAISWSGARGEANPGYYHVGTIDDRKIVVKYYRTPTSDAEVGALRLEYVRRD